MVKRQKISTLCVRGGYAPKNGEPVEVPIIQSTTFKYDDSNEMAALFDLKKEGYFYTRLQNPTNDAVAAKIAALEGGVGCVLTSSGQSLPTSMQCSISVRLVTMLWHRMRSMVVRSTFSV